jgi:hypothetical protein
LRLDDLLRAELERLGVRRVDVVDTEIRQPARTGRLVVPVQPTHLGLAGAEHLVVLHGLGSSPAEQLRIVLPGRGDVFRVQLVPDEKALRRRVRRRDDAVGRMLRIHQHGEPDAGLGHVGGSVQQL